MQTNQGKLNRRVFYAQAVYGQEEKDAVLESLDNKFLASGPKVAEFEETIAKLFGKKYGVAVNSGSSANLIAISAFDFIKGSKVITPALTFSTTVSEIVLNGLVPVFVDSEIGRYTISEDKIEEAIDGETVAILVPQLIGGVCDMVKLRKLADKYMLKLIDDSCDTFAPTLHGKTVASYADVTTTSFYGSHIITACGIGGMAMTDDKELRDAMITLRDWGRVGNDQEDFKERFDFKVDGIPYDSKFIYSHLGYNLKMNEASAAFGLEQVKKLPKFLKTRTKNFEHLYKFFTRYEQWFHLPKLIPGAKTNWLAFPLTIRVNAPFTRYDFLHHLENDGIQVRVLFSGNITRHPVYKNVSMRHVVSGWLATADFVMARGLLLGAHHGMSVKDAEYMCKSAERFLSVFK